MYINRNMKKKVKLLKQIVIPTLGISTIATVAISTSCSCDADVHVQYFLDGGSLSLQGKTSTAGQDQGVWKLYSESQEIESGITWKLTSATAEELPDSIRINDGVVSWTDQIEVGTYQFYVVATYNDKEVKTNVINLLIPDSISWLSEYNFQTPSSCPAVKVLPCKLKEPPSRKYPVSVINRLITLVLTSLSL